jgi:hypothetical protein
MDAVRRSASPALHSMPIKWPRFSGLACPQDGRDRPVAQSVADTLDFLASWNGIS